MSRPNPLDIERRFLRALRIIRGFDQSQLARSVRIKQPDISDIELGRRLPGPELMERIAKVLETTPEHAFPGEYDRPALEGDR